VRVTVGEGRKEKLHLSQRRLKKSPLAVALTCLNLGCRCSGKKGKERQIKEKERKGKKGSEAS
jgi:hypothetical protein